MTAKRVSSATFLGSQATYHADRCEPVVQAAGRGEIRLHAVARRGYPGRPLPGKMLPEVSTIGFWDATGTQTWGLDWHRNEGIELTYVSRGKTGFHVDDQSYALESGHLTITRPWQRHRLGSPHIGSTRLHWLILDVGVRRPNQPWRWPPWFVLAPADLRKLTTLLSHNEQPVWRADEPIAAGFERLAALVQRPEIAAVQSHLQLAINELFIAVMELLPRRNVTLDPRLVSSRRTVELFLAALPGQLEQPWTLQDMARRCGLGRSRFVDYCRQIVNMSPADYLAHCRIAAAKKMLREEPARKITEIALACGFQASQYFATAFRQRTGQTPRQFRGSM